MDKNSPSKLFEIENCHGFAGMLVNGWLAGMTWVDGG